MSLLEMHNGKTLRTILIYRANPDSTAVCKLNFPQGRTVSKLINFQLMEIHFRPSPRHLHQYLIELNLFSLTRRWPQEFRLQLGNSLSTSTSMTKKKEQQRRTTQMKLQLFHVKN